MVLLLLTERRPADWTSPLLLLVAMVTSVGGGVCPDCAGALPSPTEPSYGGKPTSESLLEGQTRLIFQNYHKLYRPPGTNRTASKVTAGVGPTVVRINMFISSFSSINIIEMDYTLDLLLRQRWYDTRLAYPASSQLDNGTILSLNYMKDRLWIPDLFFRNAKHGHVHTITTPNYLIWLNGSGHILFSQKLSVRLSCPMHLYKFPMDTQFCRLEMGSYGYSVEDLVFNWLSETGDHLVNVQMNENMVLNEFSPPNFRTDSCTKKYKTTGAFTCIYVAFVLKRKFGFYLIYTYLPSMLIVLISWLSFFIDYQAVPARISLGLLSILALITQSAATVQKLPRVSYIKAIDVWLFSCLGFVVLSLLEFAIVNVLTRRQERKDAVLRMRALVRSEVSKALQATPSPTPALGGGATTDGSLRLNTSLSHLPDGEMWKRNLTYVTHPVSPGVLRPGHKKRRTTAFSCFNGGGSESFDRRPFLPSDSTTGSSNYARRAQQVDWIFIFAFPSLFILFNTIYWCYFLFHAED